MRLHINNAEFFIGQVKSIVASETGVSFYDKSTKAFDSLKIADEVLVSPIINLTDITDITDIQAPESGYKELISSLAPLFQSNPFKLPANFRVHKAGRQIRSPSIKERCIRHHALIERLQTNDRDCQIWKFPMKIEQEKNEGLEIEGRKKHKNARVFRKATDMQG